MKFPLINLSLLLLLALPVRADVLVAVASNFTAPAQAIAAAFEQQTGQRVRLAFGASGKLTAQIVQGAPFEIFLSADQAKPELLVAQGQAVAASRFTYAMGKLVLWTVQDGVEPYQQLTQNYSARLALADPRLAPYGVAAQQTLSSLNLLESTRRQWVMGENISQTWQFVATGNAPLGLVALSQVMENGQIVRGSGWVVPQALYQPIHQDAVLLKKGAQNPAAQAFLRYLQQPQAQAIMQRFGYGIE
ncbi:molybdate ABC transporter substrate-binding protein [Venatoribacter cucullus]|uniref:Molybdate ABC transporter substrate-binding protein n=1 Tax=Venatoribacter cucullus TaxID=2661630 RepID=A0A9X7UTQ6_9GAMM|nr:molybdate ABC transporter substrate-binding protein [Venatoribacter cucullus]QQD23507.1 molybdate ABC transporter substrate-binding protein [Venatoribacter cucullus]